MTTINNRKHRNPPCTPGAAFKRLEQKAWHLPIVRSLQNLRISQTRARICSVDGLVGASPFVTRRLRLSQLKLWRSTPYSRLLYHTDRIQPNEYRSWYKKERHFVASRPEVQTAKHFYKIIYRRTVAYASGETTAQTRCTPTNVVLVAIVGSQTATTSFEQWTSIQWTRDHLAVFSFLFPN